MLAVQLGGTAQAWHTSELQTQLFPCFHTLGSTNEENVSQVVHSALDGKHGGAQRGGVYSVPRQSG